MRVPIQFKAIVVSKLESTFLYQKDVEDMIKEGDLDEDGRINLEEFTIIMNSK